MQRSLSCRPARQQPCLTASRPAACAAHVPACSHNTDTSYSVAIMGDLHLEPAQMHLFHEAREQLLAAMAAGADGGACSARVVQLGDLGGYKHRPGEGPSLPPSSRSAQQQQQLLLVLGLRSALRAEPTGTPAAFPPGSAECFRVASQYLDSYALPSALITGNHDVRDLP